MKVGERILYYNAMCGEHDNQPFWNMLHQITAGGMCIDGRWGGDYYIRTYDMFRTGKYEIWENTEYGILHSIKRIA